MDMVDACCWIIESLLSDNGQYVVPDASLACMIRLTGCTATHSSRRAGPKHTVVSQEATEKKL